MAKSRILPAAPADTRPRTPLISFCTVQLRTLCAACSLATLCLCTTSGPDPGELPGFWGSMVYRHAPIPRKGSGNQQQQHELARGDALLQPLTVQCSLSFYLSYSLFSRTGGILSHLNFSTHKSPWYPVRNLFFSSPLLCSLLFSLRRTQPSVKLSIIGRIGNPLYSACGHPTAFTSFCAVLLCTLCGTRPFATPSLYASFGPGLGELLGF